ncbi:hypothetical protein TKK_0019541 [Trichogramma kaykai]
MHGTFELSAKGRPTQEEERAAIETAYFRSNCLHSGECMHPIICEAKIHDSEELNIFSGRLELGQLDHRREYEQMVERIACPNSVFIECKQSGKVSKDRPKPESSRLDSRLDGPRIDLESANPSELECADTDGPSLQALNTDS